MIRDHFTKLQSYNQWANGVVADALVNNDVPEKAIELMSHIINANTIWLDRLEGRSTATKVWHVYEKAGLPEALDRCDKGLTQYITDAGENTLQSVVEYTNTKGEKFSSTADDILLHLYVHAAYHRGQIISMIKGSVPSLPVTDYIHYARKFMIQ